MQQQALKMIVGMLAVALLLTWMTWNPVPLIIILAVSYVLWHVAKGFDE